MRDSPRGGRTIGCRKRTIRHYHDLRHRCLRCLNRRVLRRTPSSGSDRLAVGSSPPSSFRTWPGLVRDSETKRVMFIERGVYIVTSFVCTGTSALYRPGQLAYVPATITLENDGVRKPTYFRSLPCWSIAVHLDTWNELGEKWNTNQQITSTLHSSKMSKVQVRPSSNIGSFVRPHTSIIWQILK